MGIVASLLGVRGKAAEVLLSKEDGFVDLDLPIVQAAATADGPFRVACRGSLKARTVGFAATFHTMWNKADNPDIPIYFGRATLGSVGPESDEFVSVLADLYGVDITNRSMLPSVEVTAAAIGCDPNLVSTTPCRFKLFFHDDTENRYAEVFLNVDVHAKILQFHEKDPEYRRNVVRGLTERA